MLENSKAVKSRNRRVVNGLAVHESWDWIVRLEFFTKDSSITELCGGTVIHRNFVLTAAHCCWGKTSVMMSFKELIFLKIFFVIFDFICDVVNCLLCQ